MAYQGMFPGENKFDVGDALSGFVEHRAQALKKKNTREALIKSGVDRNLAEIWDELGPKGQAHALENSGWGEALGGQQPFGTSRTNNNQNNFQQNNLGAQLPSHPSQYNTGTRAGDIKAYQADRERLQKANFEEQQATKVEYDNLLREDKVFQETRKLLAQPGSSSNVKQGLLSKKIFGETLQPLNAGLLDQQRAEFLGDNPSDAKLSAAEKIFPSPEDSNELKKAKLDKLIKNNKEKRKLITSRNNIVKANGGEIPAGLDEIIAGVAQNNESELELSDEEQQRYDNPTPDSQEEGTLPFLTRNALGGVVQAAKLPSRVADPTKDIREENKDNSRGKLLDAFQKASESVLPELKILKATGHAIEAVMKKIDPNEYLKPKSEWDHTTQEAVAALTTAGTAAALGGVNTLTGFMDVFKNVAVGKAAKAGTKGTAKYFGAPESVQEIAGFVADVAAPVWYNSFNVDAVEKDLAPKLAEEFKTIEKNGPKTVDISRLEEPLEELGNRIGTHPDVDAYRKQLAGVEAQVKRGKIPLNELYTFKKDLGTAIYEKKRIEFKPLWSEAKNILSDVKVPGYQENFDRYDKLKSALHEIGNRETFVNQIAKIRGIGLFPGFGLGIKIFQSLRNGSGVEATKLLNKINNVDHKLFWKYLTDMGKAATKFREADFVNSANKLGKLSDK